LEEEEEVRLEEEEEVRLEDEEVDGRELSKNWTSVESADAAWARRDISTNAGRKVDSIDIRNGE